MCSKEYVVPDFWEEHCVECGAPACYETCEKYQRGSGGLCKRFKKGIEIEQMNNGRERFKVHFLPWGKLELYWQGRLTSRRIASMIHRIYRLTSPLIRALFSEVVVRKVWRRLSLMLSRRNGQPNVWRIKCSAKSPTTLIISVVNCNK